MFVSTMKENNKSSIAYKWRNSGKIIKFSFFEGENYTVTEVDWKFTLYNLFSNTKLSIQTNPYLKRFFLTLLNLIINTKCLFVLYPTWLAYKTKIKHIIKHKEIVLSIAHGGLGDWLVYSSIPEILYNKYGIQTYISKSSIENLRNKDIYKLFFERNPYVKGIRDVNDYKEINYLFEYFPYEKGLVNFFFDLNQPDWTTIILNQFNISDKSKPKSYFIPKEDTQYKNKIIVDVNYISGKKLGWYYNDEKIENFVKKYLQENPTLTVIYVNPGAQDLETYYSMIYSCAYFVTVLSGGAALAASLDKEFTVMLPENISGGSVDGFIFKNSKGKYIR